MTTYSLTLRDDHMAQLAQHLLHADGNERAAYLLCGQAEITSDPWDREAHEKFLCMKVIPVPTEDIVHSSPTRVTWRTGSFVKALKEAEICNQTVAVVHSHPSGAAAFSMQDDENEPDLLQAAQNRSGPETRILSVILTADRQLVGRIWAHPSEKGHAPVRLIRTVGSRFGLYYPSRAQGTSPAAFNRQALAFGDGLNRDLRQLRVGVVGCGGTGSAVAMLLARLGVGQIALFDNDIVDHTNLNRLHGARQADADAMTPKVSVVARAITELGLGVRVAPINAWIGDEVCRDALRACDIIFGCTDDHDGRLFLNRFAYYYLTPVIDIGLAIDVNNDPVPEIHALDGRVTVLVPHETCLLCRNVILTDIAAEEALKRAEPAEYERRKAEAYVAGEGNPSPAVVTFTTELACMAVNEMIHRLQGFKGEDGSCANRVRKFHLNEDRRPGHKSADGCPICNKADKWGRGDVNPFLGRIN
jgi:molybdopterin/thiamine biosynthesis adenylyltransferase/proteasome lid subunit RPN8/RPN11